MRISVLIAVISAAVSSFSGPASAGVKDGNKLYEHCSSSESSPTYYQDAAACTLYIVGVYDGIELATSVYDKENFYCFPEKVIVKQITEIVANYLQKHPEKRHLPASALVVIALKDAFPCGTK